MSLESESLHRAILRHLKKRGHAMFASDLQAEHRAMGVADQPSHNEILVTCDGLRGLGLVVWTSHGWLITDAGKQAVA